MDRLLFTSASAARRIERARERIARALEARRRVTVVATGREAGRELVRRFAFEHGACTRIEPTTLTDVALAIARPSLLRRGETFVTGAGLDAVVAEVLEQACPPGRYDAVRDRPGTPRALAATLEEWMLADLAADALLDVDPSLSQIFSRVVDMLASRRLVTSAAVLARASAALREGTPGPTDVIFLDVTLASTLEAELARTIARTAHTATITLPRGDTRTRTHWIEGLDLAEEQDAGGTRAARGLFGGAAEVGAFDAVLGPAVIVCSGTTEAEECLELARVILGELDQSPPTPLDRIAIAVRDVERYRVPLSEALARAQIPFHLERAVRRPDPAGRAFLSLLECAAGGLSARAFADYLAFGVLPKLDDEGRPVASPDAGEAADPEIEDDGDGDADQKKRAVIAGALRAPRHWERLLVDAAVIGGGPERWERRLSGLAAQLRTEAEEAEDRDGPERRRAEQQLAGLERLSAFALPLVSQLARLPERASWRELLPRLEHLARSALLDPRRVLEVLAQLAPLAREEERLVAEAGLVSLEDVRRVLQPRLFEIATSPPDRGGTVRVLAADSIAGRAFDLVLVPGLVERAFPRRILEEPILPDAARAALAPRAADAIDGSLPPPLATSHDRAEDERMILRRLVQCAPRVVASFPRRDERNRERVPSLYLLELVRADRGVLVPVSRLLAPLEGATPGTEMAPGWPAPLRAERAVDAREADLSLIASLLRSASVAPDAPRKGRARFLVAGSPTLRRTLLARHNAHGASWRGYDGLISKDPAVLALLAKERPGERVHSATALESFSACPYRFYLRTIVRLKARETAESIERLDPLTRGAIIHAMQFALVARAREAGLSVDRDEATLRDTLDRVVDDVAREARDRLVPAIDEVFEDEIAAIRRDLRAWLHHLALEARVGWSPWLAELGFGEPGGAAHDPASVREPVVVTVACEGGQARLRLRGAIDLVERRGDALRATDYKTGKAEAEPGTRIGGGVTLQPLLYALTLESMLATGTLPAAEGVARVTGGRLWYCTSRGEDRRVEIALDDAGRAAVGEVVALVDRATQTAFFPRAPDKRGCSYCDYLAVCGPEAAERARRKEQDRRLEPLVALRGKP
jgi:ATP-dependent helicase/nuclease subunit B